MSYAFTERRVAAVVRARRQTDGLDPLRILAQVLAGDLLDIHRELLCSKPFGAAEAEILE